MEFIFTIFGVIVGWASCMATLIYIDNFRK